MPCFISFNIKLATRKIILCGGGGRGGALVSTFAGYVLLASQSLDPILVYSLLN